MSAGKRMPISVLSGKELRWRLRSMKKRRRARERKPHQEPLDRLSPELQAARFWAFKKLVDEVGLLPKGLAAADS